MPGTNAAFVTTGETLSANATGKCQPWACLSDWVSCSKLIFALSQGWARGGLAFTIPFAPAKPQNLSPFLYDDCLSGACRAKHLIWCRSTPKPLQTCIFAKICIINFFKYWRSRTDILWGHIGLYKSGCHNLHFTMKVPRYGHNPAMSMSADVLT